MSKTSSTYRVIEILKELNSGKTLCIENLSYKYESSTRTIRRDFELIREIFGDIFINPQKGCYQVVNRFILDDTLNSTELYMLKSILKLSQKSNLLISKEIDKSIKEVILKDDINSPYLFKQKPYEEIFKYREKFKFLESAIKFKKKTDFIYTNINKVTNFRVNPYKIVFINENFYLASEMKTKKQSRVIMSRIAMINEVKYSGKNFQVDLDIMEFIENMQTPWATYKKDFKKHLKEIIIELPKKQAKYFKLKKFLPSQKIVNEDKEGNLQISYKVTSENELIIFIKQWLPYVKVIAPNSLVSIFKNIVVTKST